MPNSMVDRATSDLLIGPDWAMNLEICDILNHDPGQASDFVKGLKKRIRSRNPKVQLLALTLLETVLKGCGDMVHMHIADKDIPKRMVKIVKKKPDLHVKEKILVLIDTWQEAFGGLHDRYPQFFMAYQDLLRAGIMFPKRVEKSAHISPHTQVHLPPSYPHPMRNYMKKPGEIGGPTHSEILVLSLADIQNAHGIMNALEERLNSLKPENKECVKQDVIIDLVEQCRLYRQRVVHLVNSTSDEELLCQGLALNDGLQNVLAKYDTLATGVSDKKPKKQKSLKDLVEIDDLNNKNQDDNCESDRRLSASGSTSNQAPLQLLLLPAPPESSGIEALSPGSRTHIDLLSGDEFGIVSTENSLALVPANETSATLESGQNVLAVSGVYSPKNSGSDNCSTNITFPELADTTASQFQQHQQILPYSDRSSLNYDVSAYEQCQFVQGSQSNYAYLSWTNQLSHSENTQQQAHTGALEQSGALPPPPWETELVESSQALALQHQHFQNEKIGETIACSPITHGSQPDRVYDHNMYSHSIHGGQVSNYNYSQFYRHNAAYSCSNPNEISHRMYGLSMQDNAYKMHSTSSSSYLQRPLKQSKPEDNMFGDLVSMAKSNKPAK